MIISLVFLLSLPLFASSYTFGVKESVSTLSQNHASDIARLKEETLDIVGSLDSLPYNNDVFYLRYCLEGKGVDDLKQNLAWRLGPGKAICDAAIDSFAKATAKSGKRNDEPVHNGAPFASIINQYITPDNTLTTSSSQGDLIHCVRTGLIDDKALMSSLGSVQNLVDYFLYIKEVNALDANDRSLQQDRIASVITANDLGGTKLMGGDASFRQALNEASKQANDLYPALNGPTLLLNLPRLMSASVKLFVSTSAKVKFEHGPLQNVQNLMDISYGGKHRDEFLQQVDKLCY